MVSPCSTLTDAQNKKLAMLVNVREQRRKSYLLDLLSGMVLENKLYSSISN
eukprot:XP_001705005.1 Hypothetical protein GL50803_34277 [Giardia lamblia ATCC 50803]